MAECEVSWTLHLRVKQFESLEIQVCSLSAGLSAVGQKAVASIWLALRWQVHWHRH